MKYRFPILTAVILIAGLALAGGETRTKLLLAVLGKGRGGEGARALPDPEIQPLDANPPNGPPRSHSRVGGNPEPLDANLPADDRNSLDPVRLPPDQRPAIPRAEAAAEMGGQELVSEAAQRVFRLRSLDAKLRQRIDLFGHQLNGKGTYKQQGLGDIKLLRLELILQAADRITSLQQVCDGRFLWVWRDSPFEKSLTRTDLKEVRRAIEAQPDVAPAGLANQWMALGGLPKLLQGLNNSYDFGPARPDQLYTAPVWVITGKIKKELLASLFPNQRDQILGGQMPNLAALPPQWPDRVVVKLGRDNALPLFPYSIEFQRTRPSKANGKEGGEGRGGEPPAEDEVTSIVTIELFEVQVGVEIDPLEFRYTPGNQEVLDDTQRFLQNLGLGGT